MMSNDVKVKSVSRGPVQDNLAGGAVVVFMQTTVEFRRPDGTTYVKSYGTDVMGEPYEPQGTVTAIPRQPKPPTVTYIITRHAAAVEWLAANGYPDAVQVSHADDAFFGRLNYGDRVIGTLPMHLAFDCICRTSKPFGFLSMTVPEHLRGVELDAGQMYECSPSIRWFEMDESDSGSEVY